MRIAFCDRCGKEDRLTRGAHVVTVTMLPLARKIDLCGDCRSALMPVLDKFVSALGVPGPSDPSDLPYLSGATAPPSPSDVTTGVFAPGTFEGVTASGRTLRLVEGNDYAAMQITIDGKEANYHSRAVLLMRDGGTRVFHTDRGVVRLPHRIGDDDRRPRLDDEIVEAQPGV